MTGKRDDMDGEMDSRALRIMEALSGVDEALLERCERGKRAVDYKSHNIAGHPGGKGFFGRKSGSLWRYSRAWAAVLCLAVAGTLSWGGYQLTKGVDNGVSGDSGGSDSGSMSMQGVEFQTTDSNAAEAETAGVQGEALQEEGGALGQTSYDINDGTAAGSAAGDNSAPDSSAERDLTTEKRQAAEEKADSLTEELEAETEMDFAPEWPYEEIFNEEAARAVEKLGDYVPTELPKGYVFEHAFHGLNTEEAQLSIYWSRGMDCIGWSISEERGGIATVDVGRPETYDVRLYQVPYAETVPAEFRESFDNPVFALEDLSLEIVRSRMISYDDKGDTDTPRGNFSVLYPSGVLVHFNGRGTPEEIWKLFESVCYE